MAIIQCPECGADISDQADACPHCGKKSDRVIKAENLQNVGSTMSSCGGLMTLFITVPVILILIFSGL